mmetsp:Transcript_8011/g.20967  ORF Transcript_8011/g.20967 Transcript_8011/m.20967 type:complete len:362 (+) Transcript_8011:128-1213(+)|eukprot:CAMPEP_0174886740 /NCGR_PEP_ID=MMETSP0167-20121228/1972_1 /TAXON_ID=38298 /ORGANISM="Rhodella maculata, Strain CCMP736" /LENGTH=361 /DNA_ID=CAMNT_0016122885 /DNA_START=44 /DNA_END=1129 /DNA_ORIENTATION=+
MSQTGVIIVGCGVPKRGMGWYHATNLLTGCCPSAVLTDIVEPYFLGAGKDTPPGKTFADFVAANPSVRFHASVADVPAPADGANRLALVSGRTADNPRLLKEVVEVAGCSHVFLEKPGAPTVAELEDMAAYAKEKNVPVLMGFNKNVTKYVTEARDFEAKTPGAVTTFIHNNAYKEEELAECFERNAEGMLKNMAVHELALLASFYGVRGDNIASVVPDKEYSRVMTLTGPSSAKDFTDFASIGFTLTTTEGKTVTVKANRTGGSFSEAIVAVDGEEKLRTKTPDAALEARVAAATAADPEIMPYFPLQHDDYVELKERAAKWIAEGKPGVPDGIASIEVAIETLKIAERLTPELTKALSE